MIVKVGVEHGFRERRRVDTQVQIVALVEGSFDVKAAWRREMIVVGKDERTQDISHSVVARIEQQWALSFFGHTPAA